MADVAIVDYGMGNIGSVVSAFARLGASSEIAATASDIHKARAIVLPGVGAFRAAMHNIRDRRLEFALHETVVVRKTPFLGICLGLQLIATDSVEGGYTRGFGWIDGHVLALEPRADLRVPHVGWNDVSHSGAVLFGRLDSAHFYFDHSYVLECDHLVTATCEYGGRRVAAVQRDNIHAVQFHPEKSQRNGLRILRNFLCYCANHSC